MLGCRLLGPLSAGLQADGCGVVHHRLVGSKQSSRASTRFGLFCPSRVASSPWLLPLNLAYFFPAHLLTCPAETCARTTARTSKRTCNSTVTSSQQGLAARNPLSASAVRGVLPADRACRIRMHPHVPDRSRFPIANSRTFKVTHAAARLGSCWPALSIRIPSAGPQHRRGPPAASPSCLRPPHLLDPRRAGSRHWRRQRHLVRLWSAAGQLPPWRDQPRQPALIARSGPHALPPMPSPHLTPRPNRPSHDNVTSHRRLPPTSTLVGPFDRPPDDNIDTPAPSGSQKHLKPPCHAAQAPPRHTHTS